MPERPGAAFPPVLHPLAANPGSSALFVDFDGTIAPIVRDPAAARPLAGATALLDRLARVLHLVAVVSGRPVSFLEPVLGTPPGLQIVGLYGLEWLDEGGVLRRVPGVERWRAVVARVSDDARRAAPAGVTVEEKGLTATLHWRGHPEAAPWARAFVATTGAATGLVAQSGRMALELRPPLDMDKGAVVEQMGRGHAAVACFGDDLGDLPAFAALDRLEAGGVAVARVAVLDAEAPDEVAAAADLTVDGPEGALALLGQLAVHAGG